MSSADFTLLRAAYWLRRERQVDRIATERAEHGADEAVQRELARMSGRPTRTNAHGYR